MAGKKTLEELFQLGNLTSRAFKEAQALEAVGKKPPSLPLDLVRAKAKTDEEINKIAERVARQQSGEFVKKSEFSDNPKHTQNLAGRSGREAKRVRNIDYTLEPTKEIRPTPTYEAEIGDVNIALPGDQTVSDVRLVDVNGNPIGSNQQGGSMYGEGKLDLEDPLFWASGEDIAQIFQKKVDALATLHNTDRITAYHLAMGQDANNFAMHFADANLRAIANSKLSPEAVQIFNNAVREGPPHPKTGEKIPMPHFVGIENPEQAYLQMMEDSNLRKWFNNRMKIDEITTKIGLPNGKDIQYAITEPTLRDLEINMTGNSVGRMVPNAKLTDTADHDTYTKGIKGTSLGKAPELSPFELSFPDADQYLRAVYNPSDITGTMQKVFPHQVVDDQHLQQLNQYYKRLREIRGFAKGGKVGKATGLLGELEKAYQEAKALETAKESFLKDSKVKDVMYHGTNRDFSQFNPKAYNATQGGEKLRGTGAMFFTPDTELANAYTGASKTDSTHPKMLEVGGYHAWPPESIEGGNVMPVHLNMTNPMIIDAKGQMYHKVEPLIKKAKKDGYDSVILKNVVDQPGAAGSLRTFSHDAHIVFDPKQIKSAIGNKGTFDPNDENILKAKGGKVGKGVGLLSELEKAFEEAKALETVKATPAVSRIDMNFKDVTKRVTELQDAANLLDEGKLSASEYDKLVNAFKPVEAYSFVPSPASYEDAMRALNKNKKPMYGMTSEIPVGENTELRLDIPSYRDHGVWINSIHRKKDPTVYDSVSSVKNATMIGAPDKAIKVAKGGPKAPFAVISGEWNPIGQEEAVSKAQEYLNHPEWTQVGYDPERHGYFYDRATMEPIESAEEVIQIGPLVLAKKPVYGKKAKQKYASGGKVDLEQEFINADTIHMAGGGWNSPNASKDPKYNGPEYELAKRSTLLKTAEILGKSAAKQLKKEWANPNGQMAIDVVGNLGADVLGSPSDMIDMAQGQRIQGKGRPFGIDPNNSYDQKMRKATAMKEAQREGQIPMLGSENVKKQLKDSGITSGIERPMTEIGFGFATPAALSKAPKVMKVIDKIADMNIPAGLSIKDVSPKTAEFRSSLVKSVNSHKMDTMPGAQWASWLQANGSKSAKKEAEATGLYDWLKTQPKVTKYDIEEHIGENLPKTETKVLSGVRGFNAEEKKQFSELQRKAYDLNKDVFNIQGMEPDDVVEYARLSNKMHKQGLDSLQKRYDDMKMISAIDPELYADNTNHLALYKARIDNFNPEDINVDKNAVKYPTRVEPGGKNYKETIVSLPASGKLPEGFKVVETFDDEGKPFYHAETPSTKSGKWRDRSYAEDQLATYAKNLNSANAYESSHYSGIDNPLFHMRTNERLTPEGKKALFMEELQSDWAQQGRDKGFKTGMSVADEQELNELSKIKYANFNRNTPVDLKLTPEQELRYDELISKKAKSSNIPTGPYVTDTKDWTALGLKHALKQAVDEGHDYLAWTTGEQQAKRYDLSKQVNRIQLYEHPDSDYRRLVVNDLEGNEVINENILPNQLPDYIGKEMSEKLLSADPLKYTRSSKQAEPSYIRELNDMDLKIGGEGMKGFYDQIVPQTMNDVMKQIGAKERVKPINVQMERGVVNSDQPDYGIPIESQHLGIEITPELREQILNEGLPHFHEGGEVDARTVKRGNIKPIDLETEFKLSKFKE